MADAIQSRVGVKPELIEGGGGIFDVKLDGELLYSKHDTGEFPEHEPLLSKIESLVKSR